MDNQDYSKDYSMTGKDTNARKSDTSGRKSYKESSPEEVKQAVKEQVSKGVAAAAGAVEGFAEEMESDRIPETAGKAIELAGEATRTIAKTTVEQARRTKEAISGGARTKQEGIGSEGTEPDASEGFGQGLGGSSYGEADDKTF
ncbi:MAG: hypothetical protein ABR562_07540 [Thermoplasmatota archaeon]|nr:hypothetical protein [Halobacteriales archaeon]